MSQEGKMSQEVKEITKEITEDGTYKIKAVSGLLNVNVKDDIKATIIIDDKIESINISLGKNSDARIINFICQKKQAVTLNDNSKCNIINILTNDSEQNYMLYEHSNIIISNIGFMRNTELKVSTSINHLEKNSKSLMMSRGVLLQSTANIRGIINISENAPGSDGYQKTDMIMLDNYSKAVSIPELNIKNDDVKCTHGATITTIDNEKLFYMQSRGIDDDDSMNLMIEGFFSSSLKDVPHNIMRDILERLK